MRKVYNFNENWTFTKNKPQSLLELPDGDRVNLPIHGMPMTVRTAETITTEASAGISKGLTLKEKTRVSYGLSFAVQIPQHVYI